MSSLTPHIKTKAQALGFDLVGMAAAFPHPDFSFFRQWIQDGHFGTMEYLKRTLEKRANPQTLLPKAQSIICVGLSYPASSPRSFERDEKNRGWISNYAWGLDYHDIMKPRLHLLANWIRGQTSSEEKFYCGVDTSPLLERSYATRAGLGWIGKNTMLLHPKRGSFFFIGFILTTLPLTYDSPLPDRCGTCSACLNICPTQALTPHHLDAKRCIAYLTLEHKGDIEDPDLRKKMGTYLAGCDLCQEVCPWNQKENLAHEKNLAARPLLSCPPLKDLKKWDKKIFETYTAGTPLAWVGFKKWQRNLKIALENSQESGDAFLSSCCPEGGVPSKAENRHPRKGDISTT